MRYILILFYLLSATSLAQPKQTWRIEYAVLRYRTPAQKKAYDSMHRHMKVRLKKTLSRMYKELGRQKFFLDFTPKESIYTHKGKLIKIGDDYSEFKIKTKTYKNLSKNQIIYQKYLFSDAYIIIDSLPDFHWNITQETKQIGKYTAIKALGIEKVYKRKTTMPGLNEKKHIKPAIKTILTEQKITAWFTPEIPVSNGPEHYGGLPGIILELHVPGRIFTAHKIIVNPKKHIDINPPVNGKKVSRKQLEKTRDSLQLESLKKLTDYRHTKH